MEKKIILLREETKTGPASEHVNLLKYTVNPQAAETRKLLAKLRETKIPFQIRG